MKLLFTGSSGFLGTNIKPILSNTYEVTTIGLTDSEDYKINFAKEVPLLNDKFDIVLHAAGKAHVIPRSDAEKQAFYDINYQGTVNLCKALDKVGVPKSFIFISTVAVYGLEEGENITESNPLNGDTPYAKSKIMAEQFLTEWCSKNNVILGIVRPSLIGGSNPPGNLGTMINSINSGRYLSIDNGRTKKSVLMVEDIAHVVPLLAEKGGVYNVCDSHHPTFRELELIISKQLNKSLPLSIPYWLAKCIALVGDLLGAKAPINSLKLDKIVKHLTFSNEKAKKELGWKPLSVIDNFKIQ